MIFLLQNLIARYFIMGVINTIIGYALFVLLCFFFENQISYLLLITVSSIISIFISFLNMYFFVFKKRNNFLKKLLSFYSTYAFTYLFNLLLFDFLFKFLNNPYIVQAICIILIVCLTSFFNIFFVFKEK